MTKLIKFGAEWCNPCKALAPILTEIKNLIETVEYDVDETPIEVLQQYKIRNIPVLILLQDNKEVWRHVGSISKEELEDKIKEYEAN